MSRNRGQCIIIKKTNDKPKLFTQDENSDEIESPDRVIIDNGKDNIATILDPTQITKDESFLHLKKPIFSNIKKEYRSKQAKVII